LITPEEIERYRAREAEREKEMAERQASRVLALRLIAIGSRALMKEAHPKLARAKVIDPWSGPVWESKPKTRCFFAPMNST
jgi:hypothetical protein